MPLTVSVIVELLADVVGVVARVAGRARRAAPASTRTGCTETSHRETLVPQGSYTLKLSPPKPMQHHLRWLGSDGARRSKAILVATLQPVQGFI